MKSTYALLFVAMLFIGCSKKTTQPAVLTRTDTRTAGTENKKYTKVTKRKKRVSRKIEFDKNPYNPFTDKRRDEYARRRENIDKPKYSNKLYFGHKKKPKKRPKGKRELCAECGIVH